MASRLTWTLSATEDLESILDYLERDSPLYASEFVEDVLECASRLEEHPHKGRMVPEFDASNIREVFVDQYRLIYSLDNSLIRILAIVHMSRDLPGIWHESIS